MLPHNCTKINNNIESVWKKIMFVILVILFGFMVYIWQVFDRIFHVSYIMFSSYIKILCGKTRKNFSPYTCSTFTTIPISFSKILILANSNLFAQSVEEIEQLHANYTHRHIYTVIPTKIHRASFLARHHLIAQYPNDVCLTPHFIAHPDHNICGGDPPTPTSI